jgi:hypothetical protein
VGESEPAFRRSQGLAASRSFCEFKVQVGAGIGWGLVSLSV